MVSRVSEGLHKIKLREEIAALLYNHYLSKVFQFRRESGHYPGETPLDAFVLDSLQHLAFHLELLAILVKFELDYLNLSSCSEVRVVFGHVCVYIMDRTT